MEAPRAVVLHRDTKDKAAASSPTAWDFHLAEVAVALSERLGMHPTTRFIS